MSQWTPPSLDDTMPDNERLTRALRKYLNISRVQNPLCSSEKTSGCIERE